MRSFILEPPTKMTNIKLITFDLDDTFWDITPVIIQAEKISRAWIKQRLNAEIKWGSMEDFLKIRRQLVQEDSRLEYDLGLLRKRTITHHTQAHFGSDEELKLFIEEAYELFLAERHKVTFYDDVVDVLTKLSKTYKLGVLTNGNADVNLLGIGHLFDFSIASSDVMSNKPDSAHFIKAKEISGIEFVNTLHIGDHPINDVKGARDLGINTMWFNSQNLKWDIDGNPPVEFNHWSQFMNLLSLHHEQ